MSISNEYCFDLRTSEYEIDIDAVRGILRIFRVPLTEVPTERTVIHDKTKNNNQPVLVLEHIFGHLKEVDTLLKFCACSRTYTGRAHVCSTTLPNSGITLLFTAEIAGTLYDHIERQSNMNQMSKQDFIIEETKHLVTVDPDTRTLRIHSVPNPNNDTPVYPVIVVYDSKAHKPDDYPVVFEYELSTGSILKQWRDLLDEQRRSLRRCRNRSELPLYGFVFSPDITIRYHHELVSDLGSDLTTLPAMVPKVKRLMNEPSDFVCMRVVTRYKELQRADPPKAKLNRLDMSWAMELLLAAQQAEREERGE